MDSSGWQRFFEGVRVEDQINLVIRTTDSLEIAVEGLARIEQDVILVRGRVAGTADARRIFIIPYDRLSNVYVNRPVALEEIDLFSPSVSLEEKARLAEEYAAQLAAAQEAIRQMGSAATDNKGATGDVRAQLDELRRMGDKATPVMKSGATPVSKQEEKAINRPEDQKLNRPEDARLAKPENKSLSAPADNPGRLALPPVPDRRVGRFTLPDRPRQEPTASEVPASTETPA